MLAEFLAKYGYELIKTVVLALFGYLGIVIKNAYHRYITDETKKSIVSTCVYAIEQLYKNLHGEEKLNKCIRAAAALLQDCSITVTEEELRLLIESAVNEMNLYKPETVIEEQITEIQPEDGQVI